MPTLPAVYDKLDAIPEPVREYYTEQDGKFVLNAEVETHPAVGGLKSALGKERDGRKKVEETYKGIDPARYHQLVKEAEEREHQGKPDLDKIVEKRVKETELKFAPVLERVSVLEKENRTLKLDDRVKAAALKAGMLPEDVDDEMTILLHGRKPRFDLNDEGRVIVLDDDGDPLNVPPEKWFAETYKSRKPKVFAGTTGSGSGARGSTGGSGSIKELENLPPAARLTRARELGMKT